MKQQNFLFVELVSSLFLLVLLIGNFMGLLFIAEGNLPIAMLGSIFLILCYFFIGKLLLKNKEVMVKKRFLHPSLLFWGCFLFLGFTSFYLMGHFINIEYNCKAQIQSEVTQKIGLVDSLSQVYKKRATDDLQAFDSELKQKLEQLKINSNDIGLRNELSLKPYNLDPLIISNPKYIDPNQVASAIGGPIQLKIGKTISYLDTILPVTNMKFLSVFTNWTRLSLVATYAKLNAYVDGNINMINAKFKELPLDNAPVLVAFDNKQLPLNNPSKLNDDFPPNYTLPLIVVIITHLFILLPFFYLDIEITNGKKSPIPGTIELK